jgi:hypothetical protein
MGAVESGRVNRIDCRINFADGCSRNAPGFGAALTGEKYTQAPIQWDDFSQPEPDLAIVRGTVLDCANDLIA